MDMETDVLNSVLSLEEDCNLSFPNQDSNFALFNQVLFESTDRNGFTTPSSKDWSNYGTTTTNEPNNHMALDSMPLGTAKLISEETFPCPVCVDGLTGKHVHYGGKVCPSCRGMNSWSI